VRYFKTTSQIIDLKEYSNFIEIDFNNEDFIKKIIDPPFWRKNKNMSIYDVFLWEIIIETNDMNGIYASYVPYNEYYIVTNNCNIVADFQGKNANKELEEYLNLNFLTYPHI